MDYKNIMYLTNLIKNDVTERDEKLKQIYERAVRESDSYITLRRMKQVLDFFDNGCGATLHRECDSLLDSIFSSPADGPDILDKMRRLVSDIQAEEAKSMDALETFGRNGEGVSVISKDLNALYGERLNTLVHSIIYYLLASGESVNDLRWNDNNSINAKLNIFNNEILKRLYSCESDVFFWKIESLKDDNKIRFSDIRYSLEYISCDEYESYRKRMDRLRVNLYGGCEECDEQKVLYVGMGNIIPCDMDDVIARLNDNSIMVICPELVCSLMNQYENARVIYERRRNGKCLFCGRVIEGKSVCDEHFKIERIS